MSPQSIHVEGKLTHWSCIFMKSAWWPKAGEGDPSFTIPCIWRQILGYTSLAHTKKLILTSQPITRFAFRGHYRTCDVEQNHQCAPTFPPTMHETYAVRRNLDTTQIAVSVSSHYLAYNKNKIKYNNNNNTDIFILRTARNKLYSYVCTDHHHISPPTYPSFTLQTHYKGLYTTSTTSDTVYRLNILGACDVSEVDVHCLQVTNYIAKYFFLHLLVTSGLLNRTQNLLRTRLYTNHYGRKFVLTITSPSWLTCMFGVGNCFRHQVKPLFQSVCDDTNINCFSS
jgi:hypothetical protein